MKGLLQYVLVCRIDMEKSNTIMIADPLYVSYVIYYSLWNFTECFKSQFLETYVVCLDVSLFLYIVLEPLWSFSIWTFMLFSSGKIFSMFSLLNLFHLWSPPLFLLFHILDFFVLLWISSSSLSIIFHSAVLVVIFKSFQKISCTFS